VAVADRTLWRTRGGCNQFSDLNRYLAGLGQGADASLADVIKSRNHLIRRVESGASNDVLGEALRRARDEFRVRRRGARSWTISASRDDLSDGRNPPRPIGDNTPGGDNNQFFSPSTGFPQSPSMGFTRGDTFPSQRADSARWDPPGGPAVLRAAVGRVATPPSRLRIRAGDSPSARTAATID
jgi:hypothetical protein